MGPAAGHPPSLAQIQGWLRWLFTEPNGVEGALSPSTRVPSSRRMRRLEEPKPRLAGWIEDGPPIGRVRRLSVYSNAYFLRLLESLGSDFEAVKRALGEGRFRSLAAEYLAQTPSRSWNITDLGSGFPGFVKTHAPSLEFPFLPDLAELEWAVVRCLLTGRLPPFDPGPLEKASPEEWARAKLVLDPSVVLLDFDWPVHTLWLRRKTAGKKGQGGLSKPRATRLAVYRDDDWVSLRSLGPLEKKALGMIAEGLSLGAVCDGLARLAGKKSPPDVQAWFSEWAGLGIIKKVEFPPVSPSNSTS